MWVCLQWSVPLSPAYCAVVMLVTCYFIAAIGKECEKYMKQGSLVPDQIIEDMIITEMKNMQKDAWLLDGNYLLVIFPFGISYQHNIIIALR